MQTIYLMDNIIKKYAWGSKTAIPALMGKQAGNYEPWAELWMGAHPEASSKIKYKNKPTSLSELIKKYPCCILGKKTAKKYNKTLPFLFKILAVARPLSIQAHPNHIQAEKGFKKENKLKIPLSAPYRNYKDTNHKPECICALTAFHVLSGFRQLPEIIKLMEKICPAGLKNALHGLQANNDPATLLKIFLSDLLTMDNKQQQNLIKDVIKKVRQQYQSLSKHDKAYEWMIKIHKYHPHDIGVLSPVLFNLTELRPGQAMFLPAGQLHTYLKGLGIEIMANSDNVIRGGLTSKHVDVQGLIKIVDFSEKTTNIISPEKLNSYEKIYHTPAEEFTLSIIETGNKNIYNCPKNNSIVILLCTEGHAVITDLHTKYSVSVFPGESVIIPFCVKNYTITGKTKLFKASVPPSRQQQLL